jgi:hypothetical protein
MNLATCFKSKFRLDPRAANVRIYAVNGIFTFCHGRRKVVRKYFTTTSPRMSTILDNLINYVNKNILLYRQE